ncbi:MAG TPA: RNA methyltransferase [Polyangiaceae bacterium]
MRRLAIALVHYPVLDAQGATVTSAITNLDVHDLARSARTYGCSDYFLVHPIAAQRELVERICEHWRDGSSGRRIPDRKTALAIARTATSLEDVYETMGGRGAIEVWVTAARSVSAAPIDSAEARARLEREGEKPVLLLFGTGWGLARSVIDGADATLSPIRSGVESGFNHLSVRAACAILLDRLRGAR